MSNKREQNALSSGCRQAVGCWYRLMRPRTITSTSIHWCSAMRRTELNANILRYVTRDACTAHPQDISEHREIESHHFHQRHPFARHVNSWQRHIKYFVWICCQMSNACHRATQRIQRDARSYWNITSSAAARRSSATNRENKHP